VWSLAGFSDGGGGGGGGRWSGMCVFVCRSLASGRRGGCFSGPAREL
jgi:hypothetical protein